MSKISLKHSGGNVVSLKSPTSAPTSADVAFKLPNQDGSANEFLKTDGSGNLSFGAVVDTKGVEMADQWRITSEFTFSASGAYITSNWERVDTNGFGQIGTGMTESSGVFTFPSTGIYLINFFGTGRRNSGNDRFGVIDLYTTTDNSNYSQAASFYVCAPSNYNRNTGSLSFLFDVTNVSTHKIKLFQYEAHGSLIFQGHTDISYNALTITRLGDT